MLQANTSKNPHILNCRDFTLKKFDAIANAIKPFANQDWALIANGSYARKEATPGSDFDYYILYTDAISGGEVEHLKLKVRDAVHEAIWPAPGLDDTRLS